MLDRMRNTAGETAMRYSVLLGVVGLVGGCSAIDAFRGQNETADAATFDSADPFDVCTPNSR